MDLRMRMHQDICPVLFISAIPFALLVYLRTLSICICSHSRYLVILPLGWIPCPMISLPLGRSAGQIPKKKYYLPSKAARLRDQIHSFRMDPDEPYHMAWERFNTILSRYPQHGLSDWALIEKFYNGLTFEKQVMFNTAAEGHIMDKKPSECVHHVTPDTSVTAALATMAREIKELKLSAQRCEEEATTPETATSVKRSSASGNPPGFQSRQNQFDGGDARPSAGGSVGNQRIEEMLENQTRMLAQLIEREKPSVEEEEPVDEEIKMERPTEKVVEKKSEDPEKKIPEVNLSSVPYPAHIMPHKYAKEYGHFLNLFKQLKVNLSIIEVLQHMPKNAKFLKDLLYNKKKPVEVSKVSLSEKCSAVVQNKLPEKLANPDKFVLTVDFVILDMEVDDRVPLILGCPFLHTAKTLIDVYDGKLTLRVGDEKVTFDAMKYVRESKSGVGDSSSVLAESVVEELAPKLGELSDWAFDLEELLNSPDEYGDDVPSAL
ncbi:hypothetical protein L1987_32823 [Smallanthus sonchifolius]|uniref:Uncharacterized protein n=1 Tax=Smallanthus sonchifolius TaxID=185202 RepID=A0ACB9HPD0_9ASTR|nr:hypothetical protein L1987_32823 [Smallanthus sonchifolius]